MNATAKRRATTALVATLLLAPFAARAQEVAAPDVSPTGDASEADAAEADSGAGPSEATSEAAAEASASEASASEAHTAPEGELATPPRQAPAPRVAVVLIGDPDPTRRAAAEALDARLGELGLQRLGDAAMRAALLGEAHADDGLERLHAARRRLLFEEDPTPALRELGERLRVDALVVVRPSEPARVAVFDVAAQAFYEEEPLLATLDPSARFVRRAARAAARRAAAPAPAVAARASEDASSPSTEATTAAEGPPARRWLRANWAYLVGGALLVGVITGFIIRGRRDDGEPPPILRFRPGLE